MIFIDATLEFIKFLVTYNPDIHIRFVALGVLSHRDVCISDNKQNDNKNKRDVFKLCRLHVFEEEYYQSSRRDRVVPNLELIAEGVPSGAAGQFEILKPYWMEETEIP